MSTNVSAAAVNELRAVLRGEVITPGDSGFDEARTIWNGDIDRRPAVIARCTSVNDVKAALAFGREQRLRIAVKSGGHSFPGHSVADGALMIEGVALDAIAAQFGTPTYVYSRAALTANYRAYAAACEGRNAHVHYAVKANSNLALLQIFAQLGAGFDIVSAGELKRVLATGVSASKVVFSGVGKNADDMRFALEVGVACFNVESIPELHRLNDVAASMGKTAPVSLRINPDVDAKTHPYISTGLKGNKFGVAFDEVLPTYRAAAVMPNLHVVGIDCHIGSQITEVSPYLDALDKVLDVVSKLDAEGIRLSHIDVGGGLGITYTDENGDEQTLDPGQDVDMGVSFFINPEIDKDPNLRDIQIGRAHV